MIKNCVFWRYVLCPMRIFLSFPSYQAFITSPENYFENTLFFLMKYEVHIKLGKEPKTEKTAGGLVVN
jgi:hypothetical protein